MATPKLSPHLKADPPVGPLRGPLASCAHYFFPVPVAEYALLGVMLSNNAVVVRNAYLLKSKMNFTFG